MNPLHISTMLAFHLLVLSACAGEPSPPGVGSGATALAPHPGPCEKHVYYIADDDPTPVTSLRAFYFYEGERITLEQYDHRDDGTINRETRYLYDEANLLRIEVTDAVLGLVLSATEFAHDDDGDLISISYDENGDSVATAMLTQEWRDLEGLKVLAAEEYRRLTGRPESQLERRTEHFYEDDRTVGNVEFQYTYDNDDDGGPLFTEVTETWRSFTYNDDSQVVLAEVAREEDGEPYEVERFTYDEDGELRYFERDEGNDGTPEYTETREQTSGGGSTRTLTYPGRSRPATRIEEYDESGNLTGATMPGQDEDPVTVFEEYTYDCWSEQSAE